MNDPQPQPEVRTLDAETPSLLDAVAEQPVTERPDPRDVEIAALKDEIYNLSRRLYQLEGELAGVRDPYRMRYLEQRMIDTGWSDPRYLGMDLGRREPSRPGRAICKCGDRRCPIGPFTIPS